jgi:hypothetical protein
MIGSSCTVTRIFHRLINAKPDDCPTTILGEREPMTLGNMRRLVVQRLVAFCLSDACRYQAQITDRIGFRSVLNIFEGLRHRTTQCKVLIQATQDELVRRRSRWISRR